MSTMAHESSNESRPHVPAPPDVPATPLLDSDDNHLRYLSSTTPLFTKPHVSTNMITELIASTYRPTLEPLLLMGRYESRGEGVEKFRACVIGWNTKSVGGAERKFLIAPQEGLSRQSALLAVIRLVESAAHKRMADLEAKEACDL